MERLIETVIEHAVVNAPFGSITIYANYKYIFKISINKIDPSTTPITYIHLIDAALQMEAYLSGAIKNFNLPIQQSGTPFQQSCWAQLLTIPYGNIISYAQQAKILNNPLGIRAIASSNGKNKIAIVVPCHRVIGSNGSLTGYAGGLEVKKWLLLHEVKNSNHKIQGQLF